jgi:hypothetical protein
MENLSDFSGTSFDIIKWQDLALKNENLRQQFMQYFREGYYSQALALITDNADIDSETVRPEVFNMINTSLTYLQNLYYNSVEVVLSEDEQQFQLMINNFINKKEFSATATYVPYNFVVYNQEIYMCLKATTAGILPTNTDYWLLIGLKGEIGATAIDTTLKYKWDYKITYSVKDVVTYDNILYVAKTRNNNSQPDINPEDWEVFMTIPRAKIIVSATEPNPDALVEGGQWWKIDEIYSNKTIVVNDENNVSLKVDDSETALVKSVEVYGNTEQIVTTGAQLIPFPYDTRNSIQSLGITFTVDGLGRISVNGTVTQNFPSYTLNADFQLPKGVYSKTVATDGLGFMISRYIRETGVYDSKVVKDEDATFDTTDWDYTTYTYRVIFQAPGPGTVYNISNFSPMINAGTTLLPFEPWSNQLPSPRPDFPQLIKGVGYSPNLLNFDEWYNTIILENSKAVKGIVRGTAIWNLSLNYITLTATDNDCYTTFNAIEAENIYKIPVKPNKKYSLTWNAIGDIGKVYLFRNGSNSSFVSIDNTTGILRITTNADTTFVTFRLGVNNTGESCTYTNLMFMEDDNFTTKYIDYADKEKGVLNIDTTGLNLFDASKLPSKTIDGVSLTNNNDGSFTITGSNTLTHDFFYTYTYSREDSLKIIEYIEKNLGNYSMTSSNVKPYFLWKIYKSFNFIEINTAYRNTKLITQEIINGFKADENLKVVIGFYLQKGSTTVPGIIKPMFWKNDNPPISTDWVPFSGIPTSAKVMLPSPLYKIGDYARDYFHYNNGQWEVVHNIKKVVLDGSIEYSTYNIMTNSKEIRPVGSEYYSMIIPSQIQGAYADNFRWVETTWQEDTVGIFSNNVGNETNYKFLSFRIPADADPNEYMDAHPTTVIFIPYNNGVNYSINESIESSKEGNESAIELSQLRSSFLPSTQMNVSSYISPTEIGLTYSADIDTYIKNNYS